MWAHAVTMTTMEMKMRRKPVVHMYTGIYTGHRMHAFFSIFCGKLRLGAHIPKTSTPRTGLLRPWLNSSRRFLSSSSSSSSPWWAARPSSSSFDQGWIGKDSIFLKKIKQWVRSSTRTGFVQRPAALMQLICKKTQMITSSRELGSHESHPKENL